MKPTQLAAGALALAELTKQAADTTDGYAGFSHQTYLPVQKRRTLSQAEEEEIVDAQRKILPRIFKSDADALTADMASPAWSAAGTGLLGAGLGGMVGGAIGGNDHKTQALTAIIGALLGGGIGGAAGYFGRQARNETQRDRMTRLPEGATRRDMKADPVYQKELDREMMLQAAMAQTAGSRW
jgi:hypothetical protein